jgi:hydroxypyruvate isomerase
MPRFAANLTMLFTELPFLDRFAAAREAGFDGVEFLFPYDYDAGAIAAVLAGAHAQRKLELVLFNLPPGDWAAGERGMACDPRRIGEFQHGVARAIEYALALGARQLHCMAGIRPRHASARQAHTAYINNLRYAAAACRPHGITLLIEPINTFDMPGYFLTGSEQAAAVIAECGFDNIKMQYDIYHMQRMEGELANTIRRHLPLIAHMQLADTPGRHEPGSGEINYAYLFGLLDALHYGGWVGCEYHPQAGTVAGLGWRERLCPPNT